MLKYIICSSLGGQFILCAQMRDCKISTVNAILEPGKLQSDVVMVNNVRFLYFRRVSVCS